MYTAYIYIYIIVFCCFYLREKKMHEVAGIGFSRTLSRRRARMRAARRSRRLSRSGLRPFLSLCICMQKMKGALYQAQL